MPLPSRDSHKQTWPSPRSANSSRRVLVTTDFPDAGLQVGVLVRVQGTDGSQGGAVLSGVLCPCLAGVVVKPCLAGSSLLLRRLEHLWLPPQVPLRLNMSLKWVQSHVERTGSIPGTQRGSLPRAGLRGQDTWIPPVSLALPGAVAWPQDSPFSLQ